MKITEEFARELIMGMDIFVKVDYVLKNWRDKGYIEQSALEKARALDRKISKIKAGELMDWLDYENMIEYYGQAIKERDDWIEEFEKRHLK